MANRIEADSLGKVKVPGGAYYGIETQRALSNFPVSGVKVDRELIVAYIAIKKAAAVANASAGKLDKKKCNAIVRACDALLKGKLSDQFVVDVFQAGAGTSTNMNVNETVANLAAELLGGRKGDYKIVHPNDDVNMSQSTNDTFHSAMNIATYLDIEERLLPALARLSKELERKAAEFGRIIKLGRTHLQDAVPIYLGQEFSGYAGAVESAKNRVESAAETLLSIPLGSTAIGTGLNAPRGFAERAVKELSSYTGSRFRLSRNRFASMQYQLEQVNVSDALKELAIVVNKVANDLRLLNSGPRGGIGEIALPDVQPGSSIMPGKVNPSMAEMMNMVCFQVIGICSSIDAAADAGQLELNVFMPIIAHNLLYATRILSNGIELFTTKCVRGVKPNRDRIESLLERDLSLATALTPYIGYAKAAKIARLAQRRGKSVKEICLELKVMDSKKLDEVLNPRKMA